jgi:hypothetical protein
MDVHKLEDIERMTVINRLAVRLTKDELLAKSRALMLVEREIARTEDRKKEFIAETKDQLETSDLLKQKLLDEIESESEQRDIDCTLERDYLAFTVRTIRNDTGDTVGVRPMGDSERQRSLPTPEPPVEEAPEKEASAGA